jgi:AAA ATPase domain
VKTTELVGRAPELASLSGCVESATAGHARVAWIDGVAGSGKTGLVRALLDRLPPSFRILRSEADPLATDVALDLVRQLGPLQASDGYGAGLELLQMCDEVASGRSALGRHRVNARRS